MVRPRPVEKIAHQPNNTTVGDGAVTGARHDDVARVLPPGGDLLAPGRRRDRVQLARQDDRGRVQLRHIVIGGIDLPTRPESTYLHAPFGGIGGEEGTGGFSLDSSWRHARRI